MRFLSPFLRHGPKQGGCSFLTVAVFILMTLVCSSQLAAADAFPGPADLVWLPMDGVTEGQMDQAVAAGFTAIMMKVAPVMSERTGIIDLSAYQRQIEQASSRGLKLVVAIVARGGLAGEQFYDVEESGEKLPHQLDPFCPEAMTRAEQYFVTVIRRFREIPGVIAFAPTWGIYGEAGFTSWSAGRSPHALARFNEWLGSEGLPVVTALPTRQGGPNTAFNRFIRFRYLYLESRFSAMIERLKTVAGPIPVGTWQELYSVSGYLWTMVRVPSADFALYESCFPFQTTHDSPRTLAETMGLRYRCRSASDYRDYYLPLLARKRGEGQRFMGCQLSQEYAVRNFGWSAEKAREVRFDQWEDEFAPVLAGLNRLTPESPRRDVLLVFPTYGAAALSEPPAHDIDVKRIDLMLRSYGCQMERMGLPRLDQMSVEQMNAFRLIVVPEAAYILSATYEKLKRCNATVLFTGCFGQSLDGALVTSGESREIDGRRLRYGSRPACTLSVTNGEDALTRGLLRDSRESVRLPEGEGFAFEDPAGTEVLLRGGDWPLLSARLKRHLLFIHGQLFAGLCHDPQRKPPVDLAGSGDSSANEVDTWGPYSSTHPQNRIAYALIRNIQDFAGVEYRVLDPSLSSSTRYLGDHMEAGGVSANIAYNNLGEPLTLRLRLPWRPAGIDALERDGRFECAVTIPAFGYRVIEPAK